MSESEPVLITTLRELAPSDTTFGRAILCPSGTANVWRQLGIRPELLTEHENGDRVYRVTPKQAAKALKRWDEIVEEEAQRCKSVSTLWRLPCHLQQGHEGTHLHWYRNARGRVTQAIGWRS